MSIQIVPVQNHKDLVKFIKSQWLFYKDDPYFVPPLMADRLKLFNREKNPFFKHSEMQEFLAYRNNNIVGRIAAIKNDNHNITHNDKVGFFGFFESINDQEVANALFLEVEQWLAKRGLDTMRGPENPSQNDEIGLLIEGFNSPPMILMEYNPPYYIDLIKNSGFNLAMTLYAWLLDANNYMTEKLERLQKIVRERYKITIRPVNFKNKKQFKKDVDTLKYIYNMAWEKNWGFVKMTDEEFDFLVADLKQVADPNLALICEIDGKPAGVALGVPDINQVLIYNKKGSMLGAAWNLMTKSKKIDQMRVIILGVLKEYRNTGADSVLYYELSKRAIARGITKGEASWVLEINQEMNRALQQTIQGTVYKKYGLYERPIPLNQ
ncbi:MAG TPA: hypothetical protein PLC04_02820 [Candidatus Kapabacteria bacterium]|jgi:GNAT superfamily N-acetyltransferase|nr:hypothetical protein [Candidatus Kapabacteria bacterium]